MVRSAVLEESFDFVTNFKSIRDSGSRHLCFGDRTPTLAISGV